MEEYNAKNDFPYHKKAVGIKPMSPLKRQPLYVQAIGSIGDFLRENSYREGDKLPTEAELADMLGVGRNTIREALKTLQALGIIQPARNKGTVYIGFSLRNINTFLPYISIFDTMSIHEVIETRLWLEPSLADIVIQKADHAILEKIRAVIEADRKSIGSFTSEVEYDYEFHRLYASIPGNSIIAEMSSVITSYFITFYNDIIPKIVYSEKEHLRCIDQHEKILQSILSRDSDALKETLIEHLSKSLEIEDKSPAAGETRRK